MKIPLTLPACQWAMVMPVGNSWTGNVRIDSLVARIR